MARLLRYTGTVPKETGRHGVLEPGQVIEVDEDEFHSALTSDEFEAVDMGFPPPEDCPPPRATTGYDLAAIHWTRPRLTTRLKAKSRSQLTRIAQAMEEVTGQSIPHGQHASRAETADAILSVAVTFGWTTPAK